MEAETYSSIDIKKNYDRDGFIVLRSVVSSGLCELGKQAFIADVWRDKSFFVRHEFDAFERHALTEAGFMRHPIRNIQDLRARKFERFRQLGMDILTSPKIQQVMFELLGDKGQIFHTMYFDGNQTTWVHRDGDYIGAKFNGPVVGVWVAAEDIHPGSGRFYVHKGSHLAQFPPEWNMEELDPNSVEHKACVSQFVRERSGEYERIAPQLKQGDAIFWSGQTMHGSLPTEDESRSRRSFTAHYTPIAAGIQQRSNIISVNGVPVQHNANQMRFLTQLDYRLRTDHPQAHRVYSHLKKMIRTIRPRRDVGSKSETQ